MSCMTRLIARPLIIAATLAMGGCAPALMTSPGAESLAPEQSAWLVTHDYVKVVSLDGVKGAHRRMDAFVDGVGVMVKLKPGRHDVEIVFDDGGVSSAATSHVAIDTVAGKTYYVKNTVWGGFKYGVFEYKGAPDEAMLKHFKANSGTREMAF